MKKSERFLNHPRPWWFHLGLAAGLVWIGYHLKKRK